MTIRKLKVREGVGTHFYTVGRRDDELGVIKKIELGLDPRGRDAALVYGEHNLVQVFLWESIHSYYTHAEEAEDEQG